MQTALRILIALALAVLTLPLLGSSASASTVGGFEIDGDRAAAGGLDWDSIAGTQISPDGTSGTDASAFQGGSETSDPLSWSRKEGLAKQETGGDIRNMWTYDYVDSSNGDAWFYFAFDRLGTGVGGFTVELNQKPNQTSTAQSPASVPDRTENDVLINFNQASGSTGFTLESVRIWRNGAWDVQSGGVIDGTNFDAALSADGLFAEMGINLTDTGLQPACEGGFTTLNLRSRSSSPLTSTLKDYIVAVAVSIPARCRTLTIIKQDDSTPAVRLGGATFSISPNPLTPAAVPALVVTDGGDGDQDGTANGSIVLRTEKFKTYTVTEVTAPGGYIRQSDTEQAVVQLGDAAPEEAMAVFTNRQGAVSLVKEDADSTPGTQRNARIGFATFVLEKVNGEPAASPITVTDNGVQDTDDDPGEVTVTNLSPGTWQVREDVAPTGYLLDDAAWRQFVVPASLAKEDSATVRVEPFTDSRKKSELLVRKVDADAAGTVVPGAVFELWKESNSEPGLQDPAANRPDTRVDECTTTGTAGCSASDQLDFGTYYWLEISAPTGYELPTLSERLVSATAASVTITAANAGTAIPVTEVSDRQTRSRLSVVKHDADRPGTVVPGATFSLYREANGTAGLQDPTGPAPDEYVDECTTSGTSACTVGKLAFGTYYWLETDAPVGYRLPAVTARLAVASANAVTFTADNAGSTFPATVVSDYQKRAELKVVKHDADAPGTVVAGATFELWKDTNATAGLQRQSASAGGLTVPADDKIDSCVTSGDAPCAIDELRFGTYYWVETEAPVGYVLPAPADAVSAPVVVDAASAEAADFAVTVISDHQVTSALAVVKQDADAPGTVVPGATFQLWKEANATAGLQVTGSKDLQIGECTTTGVAPCGLDGLTFGTYYWLETDAPVGYVLPQFAVSDPIVVTANTAAAGSYPTTVISDHQLPSRLEVIKYDADSPGTVVAGATFQLWKDANGVDGLQVVSTTPVNGQTALADDLVGSCTTAGDAACSVDEDLGFGTYYWVETDAPAGYVLPSGQDAVSDPITIDAATAQAGGYPVTVISDHQKESELAVLKHDAETGNIVDGATFELWRDTNTVAGLQLTDTTLAECTTTGRDACTVDGLGFGTYYWVETDAPAGYVLPSGQDAVSDPITIDAATAEAGDFDVTVIKDHQKKSELGVVKHDAATGNIVDGATFELWQESGDGDVLVDTCTTSGGGPCAVDGVAFGSYYWVETEAPEGYVLPLGDAAVSDTVTVNAANAGTAIATTVIEDSQVTSRLSVVKHDADVSGTVVPGATFELWQEANQATGLQSTGTEADLRVDECTTTDDGPCSVGQLGFGTYYWLETVAPQGYVLPAGDAAVGTPITIDAGNAGSEFPVTVVEDPQKRTTLEIAKGDDDTGERLAGAVFTAYLDVDGDGAVGPDDTVLGDRTSDEDGVATWTELGFGQYLVEEVSAPEGYGYPETTMQVVEIDATNAGGTIQVNFWDPALGGIAVAKVALERDASGSWRPSDGEVAFGAPVKYLITARANGAKVFHDVELSDYVPGHDPSDTGSTTETTYVDGSADCAGTDCAVTFDEQTQRLTWSLGDLRGAERTVEFVVRMPAVPQHPLLVDGEHVDTVVNVADLSWGERETATVLRRADAFAGHTMRSNAVVTALLHRPEVLDTPPAIRPGAGTPPTVRPVAGKPPLKVLPATGAPGNSGLFTVVGGLAALLGGWLMLVGRRRGCPPQR
ncbi:MAG TPA: SpaA isopeptide-forming pilin-related protein [Nocardioidaceae bacterium]|nr:SpaA isopeptide-forming pilin-related protein [Nocardioidaceae bacterium]